MKAKNLALAISGLCLMTALPADAGGNRFKGKWMYMKKCTFCHDVDLRWQSVTGPHLRTIVGRKVAAIETISYSPHLRLLAEHGVTWEIPLLRAFAASRDDSWFAPYRKKLLGNKCAEPNHAERPPACAPYIHHAKRRPVRPDDLENILAYLRAFVRKR
ncbi:MAG: hypothetical protein CMM48_04500 [Rhodospirillaceae bacterium]|nr:hypothetical protein [Rhodospirillaceae bacterium]